MKNPCVTIIMATYNRAHLIVETLISVQNQSYSNWECLIIDDGSNDNTKEILKPFLYEEFRFKYLKRMSKYQKGLPGCRNMGLDLAKGDYIVFFDDDDLVHPQLLELCIKEFKKRNIGYCRYERRIFYQEFNENLEFSTNYSVQLLGRENLSDMITGNLPFNSCQIMWKKECFNGNYFHETLMYAEEWELYSRILSSGIKGISIDKVLFYGRKHPHSNTGEFGKNNKIRVNSKIEASKLIIENLSKKSQITPQIEKFFIRLSFSLKSYDLLLKILSTSKTNKIKNMKYKMGYTFYPILKPIFKLKGKLKTV